jgi:uncharacterized protein
MFFSPLYFAFLLPGLALALYAQWRVKSTYAKMSQIPSENRLTGAQVARRLLDAQGLYNVQIERVPGELTDHYDPREKVLRLSDGVYGNYSVAAQGIVAHEIRRITPTSSFAARLSRRSISARTSVGCCC